MKVETKGNSTIIKDTESDLVVFLMKVTHEYKSFESKNMIIDLSGYEKLSSKEIATFLPLSQTHRKAKKSFVVVGNTDSSATGKVVVVPTVQEALDTIEMDEIERDLGF